MTGEDSGDSQAPPSPVGDSKATPPPGRKRDNRSRVDLIQKLPTLEFENWSAREDFRVDEEWSGIVALGSDAVLGPLEPLAPNRREG